MRSFDELPTRPAPAKLTTVCSDCDGTGKSDELQCFGGNGVQVFDCSECHGRGVVDL